MYIHISNLSFSACGPSWVLALVCTSYNVVNNLDTMGLCMSLRFLDLCYFENVLDDGWSVHLKHWKFHAQHSVF
jgi:hypothetical protein